ncbi:steroid 5-alpha-reductase DET2 [Rhodamnia argentea]|uniref:Steroid 5-alpha-reductase DET2 n=1 Tax=Rhodamnia argentea TaxID=178133 RepID=A0A8B8NQU4_9MYRT|nr:steroid 5-alpha-reductase DET2 [Rhodamnia argentea]XP_030524874.1 steroid 5-alpha-reductase DET2 [Rhodamnia argentea]XP_030524875.1 steroid 5-alpha-reductase DET2 [Rhodamnia argentea]
MLTISDDRLFHNCLLTLYLIAPPTFISLRYIQAPYGKHHRSGWGPTISPALAWFLMESPTLWLTLLIFPFGKNSSNPRSLILISPFLFHYFHRTIIYPLRIRSSSGQRSTQPNAGNRFPVTVALMGFGFNVLNAYVQARWVSNYESDGAAGGWWFWGRFLVGLVIFVSGMWMNVWSDIVLVGFKREGKGYRVPRGGLFEYVSCPNYFGEIVEWLGWAVMTWSWGGFGFFLYTCANLVPRARGNHRWYLDKFGEEYPKSRQAVIPFLY